MQVWIFLPDSFSNTIKSTINLPVIMWNESFYISVPGRAKHLVHLDFKLIILQAFWSIFSGKSSVFFRDWVLSFVLYHRLKCTYYYVSLVWENLFLCTPLRYFLALFFEEHVLSSSVFLHFYDRILLSNNSQKYGYCYSEIWNASLYVYLLYILASNSKHLLP